MMNDKKSFESGARDYAIAGDALHDHQVPERFRWVNFLKHRWPTALAIGMFILWFGGGDALGGLAEVLLLLPLLYLVVAAMQRREATWVVFAVGITVFIALRALDVVAPSSVFVIVALIVLVWGAVRGQLHKPGMFRVQALGMLGFGAIALIGMAVNPDLGRYLVAAGWFLHGIWDFVHLWADKVVVRSYAEWCSVLDILIAAELIFLV